MRLLRGANFPPHSAISGTGRRLAVLAVRAGTGLKRIRARLARRGRARLAPLGRNERGADLRLRRPVSRRSQLRDARRRRLSADPATGPDQAEHHSSRSIEARADKVEGALGPNDDCAPPE